jgi:FtsP/CotA-like multicopper oxidase with cupredoxin domain
MQDHTPDSTGSADQFPTDATGLPEADRPALTALADGDELDLRVEPVAKQLGDITVRMLAYNGSIPGPTLKAQQGTEIVVHVTNNADLDTTVHWHGLRLENRYDGVPHETQAPIPVGGEFSYRIQFPDPGLYWYHPHIREDYAQELGLYGNILVVPADPEYWPPADRDIVLTLDDILLEDGEVAPFSRTDTTYAAMGRFGNLLLISGEPDLRLTVRAGELVRLWLTNTANTRVFNVCLPGARMKLVGGDSGRVEREEFVNDVVIAPSERAVVDVLFDQPGALRLEHHTPKRSYTLATVTVGGELASTSQGAHFETLRLAPELQVERQRLAAWLAAPPDKILALVAQMDDFAGRAARGGSGHVHLPDASRRRQRPAGPLPEVRHEAAGNRAHSGSDHLRLPDASRGDQRPAQPLPQMRHEAARRESRHSANRPRRGRDAPRRRARHPPR